MNTNETINSSGLSIDTELIPETDSRAVYISIDPERMGGAACFRGTRVPVQDLWDFLAAGGTIDEFLENFPTVRREQLIGILQIASSKLLDGLPIR